MAAYDGTAATRRSGTSSIWEMEREGAARGEERGLGFPGERGRGLIPSSCPAAELAVERRGGGGGGDGRGKRARAATRGMMSRR